MRILFKLPWIAFLTLWLQDFCNDFLQVQAFKYPLNTAKRASLTYKYNLFAAVRSLNKSSAETKNQKELQKHLGKDPKKMSKSLQKAKPEGRESRKDGSKKNRKLDSQLKGKGNRRFQMSKQLPWWMTKEEKNNPKILQTFSPWWLKNPVIDDKWTNEDLKFECNRRGIDCSLFGREEMLEFLSVSSAVYDLSDNNFKAAQFSNVTAEVPKCYPESYEAPSILNRIKEQVNRQRM